MKGLSKLATHSENAAAGPRLPRAAAAAAAGPPCSVALGTSLGLLSEPRSAWKSSTMDLEGMSDMSECSDAESFSSDEDAVVDESEVGSEKDLSGDGGVIKRVIKAGKGVLNPAAGDEVFGFD